jgi:hypothetical protein
LESLESYNKQEEIGAFNIIEVIRNQFRLLGPLSQVYNIVVHIRGSAGRTQYFHTLIGRLIPMDNHTRWNSWYQILQVLLNLRPAVEKYYQGYKEELEENILSSKD